MLIYDRVQADPEIELLHQAQAPGNCTPPTPTGPAFTVDTTADTVDADPGDGICADPDGYCSLRAAVMEANAFPGADTINLPAGNYLFTIAGAGEDGAATGDLDLTDDVTIAGPGAGLPGRLGVRRLLL